MTEQPAQIVLVVDGEVLIRHEIAEYLRDCGYRVVEAASTDEAWLLLETSGLVPAFLLCSAVAPGNLNAFTLRQKIGAALPDVDVIMAGSLDAKAEVAADLCEQGPDLARPYDPQLVLDRIRRVTATSARSGISTKPSSDKK
jgi:DNA-binding response OmpR family regulator